MAIVVKGMAPLLQMFDMPASLVFYRDKLGFIKKSPCLGSLSGTGLSSCLVGIIEELLSRRQ